MSTDFKRPSEETEDGRARATATGMRVEPPRSESLLWQDQVERVSELPAGSHANGGPRHRSSTALVRATREPDGDSRPIPSGTIAVADLYGDLAAGLSAEELKAVRHALVLPVVRVHRGGCEVKACGEAAEARKLLGVVVIDGLLVGEIRLAGHVSAQIYGPGDLLSGDHEPNGSLVTAQALHAPLPTSVAVLDERFVAAMRRWPRLAARFFTQAMRQVDRTGEHRAICQLARVEDRLLTLFWYLADRWGRVRPDGVMIDLPLTHETIGRLIGARRPTVTLGLRELARQGLLRREQGGRWLLATESLQRVNGPDPGDGRYSSSLGVAS